MTAEQILAIKRPEWLFTGATPAEVKQKHRELAKEWHPDVNKMKEAEHVFQHVSVLYEEALKKIENNCWGFSGVLKLTSYASEHSGWSMKYHVKHPFELGECYVGDNSVVYILDKKDEDLFYNAKHAIKNLKYPSAKVETECSRYLPNKIDDMTTNDGRLALAVKSKTPDLLCLRDVVNFYKGGLHPTQAAWIMSGLLNLGCYLWVTDVTHNDISLDTYFISPEKHSGALYGGWWYAAPRGHLLTKLTARTFEYLPHKVKVNKKASRFTDQELIRLVGREMLGDGFAGAPEPMKEFLNEVAGEDAVTTYQRWTNEVLVKSFGKRRFVKMDLNVETLYH